MSEYLGKALLSCAFGEQEQNKMVRRRRGILGNYKTEEWAF
jgi:hypothetical protein